jgi:hypothetical protein
MGCNCKQVKKIEKNMPFLTMPTYEKKGWRKIYDIITKGLWKLFGYIIVVIFTLIAIPVIPLMAMFNYFKTGEMFISMPFIEKKARSMRYNAKNTEIIK